MGVVYYHLGNVKKATTVLEGACPILREVLGYHYSRVANTMYHLAVIKRIRYDIDQPLHLLNNSVKIQLSTIGRYNHNTKALLDVDEIEKGNHAA